MEEILYTKPLFSPASTMFLIHQLRIVVVAINGLSAVSVFCVIAVKPKVCIYEETLM